MIIVTSTSRPVYGVSTAFLDQERARKMLDLLPESLSLVKTASGDGAPSAAGVLLQALASMNLNVNVNLGELIQKVMAAEKGRMEKTAAQPAERKEIVTIASKEIKDSHYQFDISKDVVAKNGKQLILVSAYLRDAYLGRYLIKRNYYFAGSNQADADETFNDLVRRAEKVKRRYYDEKTPINGIFAEYRAFLDSVKADVSSNEDEASKTP